MTDAKTSARPLWKSPKVWFVTIALIVLLVVVLQNLKTVEVRVLFLTMQMPIAALIAIVAALAFMIGVVTDGRMLRRKAKQD